MPAIFQLLWYAMKTISLRQLCCLLSTLLALMPIVLVHSTNAQTLVNDYATQPDVWRPERIDDAKVDARGDLNLKIPVLTVPGRNGLDFDVTFTYTSGIKAKQLSSWIGTGWLFDPGSISRDVRSLILNGEAHNVDFSDVPEVQPDIYYVTTPNERFSMVRNNDGSGSTTTTPPTNSAYDFVRTDWRPWRIETTNEYIDNGTISGVDCVCTQVLNAANPGGRAEEDIASWTLTDDRGVRYVFAHPTIGSFIGLYSSQNLHSMEYYVNSWRLIAILGRDYDGPVPTRPEDLAKDAPGSWIRFEYTDPATTSYVDTELTGFTAVRQAAYLKAIETPTHRAEFATVEKSTIEEWPQVWNGGLRAIHRQLQSIKLLANPDGNESVVVREVQLVHSDRFEGFEGTKRLALDAIEVYGVGGAAGTVELPGYRMTYYDLERGFLDDYDHDVDDFGYYNADPNYAINTDTVDARAWSLRSLVHPLGFKEEYVYSNDDICYYCDGGIISNSLYPLPFTEYTHLIDETSSLDRNFVLSESNNRQGGTRVVEVLRYEEEDGEVYSSTQYTYSGGRAAAIPSTYLEKTYPTVFFKNVDRGRATVYYNRVKKTNPDGTYTEVYYTTDVSHPEYTSSAQTAIYQIDSDRVVLSGNQDMLWGKEYRVVSSEGDSRETELETDLTSYKLSEVVSINGEEISNIWYYGRRRIEESSKTYYTGALGVGQYVETNRSWTYEPEYGLVREERLAATGVQDRLRRYQYAFEIPEYNWAEDRNIISAVVKEDRAILAEQSNQFEYYNSQAQTWKTYSGFYIDQQIVVPHPHEQLVWRSDERQLDAPSPETWTGTLPAGSEWVPTQSNLDYNIYGNPTRVSVPDHAEVELKYAVNESRIASVVARPSGDGLLMDTYTDSQLPEWDNVVNANEGSVRMEMVGGMLEIQDGGLENSFENDHVRYELGTPVSGHVLLEMDVIPAESDDRSLFVSIGDASWANAHNQTGVGVWLCISDDRLLSYDRRKWRQTEAVVTAGLPGRLIVSADLTSSELIIEWGGLEVYRVEDLDFGIDEVSVLAIGTDGSSSTNGTTYVDNVRLLSAADQAAQVEYDPVHLRPRLIVDESNVVSVFTYDGAGRLSGKQKSDLSRLHDYRYQLGRASNADTYDLDHPGFTSSVSYSRNLPGAHFRTGNTWEVEGTVSFGRESDGRWIATIGGGTSSQSGISLSDIETSTLVVADAMLDSDASGDPFVLSLSDGNETVAIRRSGSTGNLCAWYSTPIETDVWDCWNDISPEPDSWFTAELRRKTNTEVEARILMTGQSSQVSSTKLVAGLSDSWIPELFVRTDDDVIVVSDIYVGSYVETTEYYDSFGRTVQKHASSHEGRMVLASSYDNMHRLKREYLPVPATSFVSSPETLVQDYYEASYGPSDVWPYTEYQYDSNGRIALKLPPQVAENRTGVATTYTSESFFTGLSTEPGPPVKVVTTVDENGNPSSSIFDALGREIHQRRVIEYSADQTIPANITISAERDNGGIYSPSGITPTDVDLDDWDENSYDWIPERSYLVGYSIEIDVQQTGQANVVLKEGGSTISIWVFDNSQTPTVYAGYFPVLAGLDYSVEVNAGVSNSDEYPGYARAEVSLTFQTDGNYLAFHETGFSYDANDNLVRTMKPVCYSDATMCEQESAHSVSVRYDTDSNLLARTSPNADGNGDGNPSDEQLSTEPDTRFKNSLSGKVRFVEDPVSRNDDAYKFHVVEYDALGRTVGTGYYRGKYSFDSADPTGSLSGLTEWREQASYMGGRKLAVEYDSTRYRYSYDGYGRIANLFVKLPGLDEKEVQYGYDDLGNIVMIAVQPDSDDEAFYAWYEYNEAGKVASVSTNSANDKDSATSEAVFEYDESLRPSTIFLGAQPLQTISYSYSIQGYLTGINDLTDESSGVFAERIGYDTADEVGLSTAQAVPFSPMYNGLKSWAASRTTGNTAGGAVGGFTYEYDRMNRMVRADFGKRYGLRSRWSSSLLFDVGGGNSANPDNPIDYDPNGNVTGFVRRNEFGGKKTTTLDYRSGSDRLVSTGNAIQGDYLYDFNGNIVELGNRGMSLTYDERNQVVSTLSSEGTYTYRYDHEGRRVKKSAPDPVYYVRGLDGAILAVYDAAGDIVQWNIVASGNLIGYAVP